MASRKEKTAMKFCLAKKRDENALPSIYWVAYPTWNESSLQKREHPEFHFSSFTNSVSAIWELREDTVYALQNGDDKKEFVSPEEFRNSFDQQGFLLRLFTSAKFTIQGLREHGNEFTMLNPEASPYRKLGNEVNHAKDNRASKSPTKIGKPLQELQHKLVVRKLNYSALMQSKTPSPRPSSYRLHDDSGIDVTTPESEERPHTSAVRIDAIGNHITKLKFGDDSDSSSSDDRNLYCQNSPERST